jgi:thiol-disulfide isomerase/thioredoxin
MDKVAAAYPGFAFAWVDTEAHKDWVEAELDVPSEYLPLVLARVAEDRYWYDEFPFARGIKEWLEAVKSGEREPLRWLTSAEPAVDQSIPAVLDLTASNFAETIGGPKPTLIAVVSEWCDHCKSLKPVLQQVAEANANVNVASFVYANNSYCGFEAKPGEMDQTSGVDGNGEDVPGLGMKQLEKVCWPARLPLKRYKAFKWRSVPTIFSVSGEVAVKYDGPRNAAAISAFLSSRHGGEL